MHVWAGRIGHKIGGDTPCIQSHDGSGLPVSGKKVLVRKCGRLFMDKIHWLRVDLATRVG